ncbi:MAG: peptidase S8 [Anaerolineaceae bacterium]|nr:MAG: peptidase S8 [Anaerolineaceae bacterium]
MIADQPDVTITPGLNEAQSTEETVSETPTPQIENKGTTDETPVVPSVPPTFTATPPLQLAGNYVKDEILVRFNDNATEETIAECLQQISGEVESTLDEIRVAVIQIEAINVSNALASLAACPAVRYVEPNFLAFMTETIPTDSSWSLQYGLVNIHAPQGWDLSTGAASITIAVVDTGVDLSHPDLVGKIVDGYDFVNNDDFAQDDNGHGTHVAGIAAATGNNGTGIAGVSWGARIMPIKVLNSAGSGSFADVAAGIIWAADNGAQIINLSLGGTSNSAVLQSAVDYAHARGIIMVAAAGNTGSNFVLYPARYFNVIAVGATDSTNTLTSFSNHGPELDLSAPGAAIYSTSLGGTYVYRSGSSMAAPFVSGLAAILRGIPGNGGSGAITMQMQSSALDLGSTGRDDFYGYGLIQMDAAIQRALLTIDTTPPVVSSIIRANTNPSSAASVDFTVIFSETVIGVDISDFTLATTGISGASITSISGTGETYRVTIKTGSGNGTIRLDVIDDDSIMDVTSNSLNGDFTIGQTYDIAKDVTFSDVSFDHPQWAYIEAIWNAGYTSGCDINPLRFCPDQPLTRAELAVFMLRGNFGADYVPPVAPWNTFIDDWSPGDWAEKWAEGMWLEGLTAGCQDPNEITPKMFCPWDLSTRDQISVFGLRMKYGMNYTPPVATGTMLADMTDVDYWGTKWAEQAYLDQLLPSCGVQGILPLYCPDDLVNRAWGAYLIVKAKDLTLP